MFVSSISTALWEVITCRNVAKLFHDLEVPFGLYVGAEDELVDAEQMVALAMRSRVALKDVQLIPHTSHIGNLITATAYIVPFIKLFSKIVTPALSFKIRRPQLDAFERLQFIGRGSFGRVYLVRHRVTEKYFAMKVLNKADILKAKEVRHVVNEKMILHDLNSQFVVAFVGSFQDSHHLYFVMEFVIGGELFTQLSLQKRFTDDVAKFYAAEIILFFEDIHSKSIVYRDLKVFPPISLYSIGRI